ncbi:formate dehydrogenase accessory sulfurtransferase FdhD [Microbacterium sp. SSM24]|uniref:formate dehydrogenase accessory sulfurtransferase FdhD n=1 Tax=Microbacterium sp. SSM24 TaxID=2991714 RepID=UPI002226BD32|nr:formate dehydrogenase accessory sulfurtransferase FdhD [Microbacterium sp. SSM24]MCW3492140.1 formate dehydrogenase accessory sulfurtransferase FdhD [Microbacterium sp. SSM24]
MGRLTVHRPVVRITRDGETVSSRRRSDTLVVEEPLEIRVGGAPLAITMRTPGHDVELAAGFLVSEGVISHGGQFRSAIHCGGPGTGAGGGAGSASIGRGVGGGAVATGAGVVSIGTGPMGAASISTGPIGGAPIGGAGSAENTYNVLDVALAPGVAPPDPDLARRFYTTSSCGLCGKASIEAVETVSSYDVGTDAAPVDAAWLLGLPDRLREEQAVFGKTGGLHAAGLFDAATGELLVVREDVGRHNAVDKVVGWAVLADRLPLRGTVLQVSGRASFELVQKAVMAGIPILSAVSAPSSLAVELAAASGLTLAGFVRGESMNVYSVAERVRRDAAG